MNQGIVDIEGHWRPIFSTGRRGIDQYEWYKEKIDALKAELGYDSRSADIQHSEAQWKAVREVFGDKWYEQDVDHENDPRVKKAMKVEDARYKEFCRERHELDILRRARLDNLFMQALERETESERPTEVGLIDDEHIKETCRVFCESYKGNVGMMANCLDKMAVMGYDPWCTCTDCGEQFQCHDYDSFGCSIDEGCYHGDGGIGVIMGRILCDRCHEKVACPGCCELDIPNPYRKDGKNDYDSYDFLACVLLDWLGVCWGCASGFEDGELKYWDDTLHERCNTALGAEFYAMAEKLEEEYGLDGHELNQELKKTLSGKRKLNEIRNLLADAVERHFGDALDESWFTDRFDVDDPRQMKLPGILEGTQAQN